MDQEKPVVVIAEDDPASTEALAYVVRDWGAEAVFGLTTAAILQQLGPRRGAIAIIVDYNLGPGPDGLTLARELLLHLPLARVLVLSGSFYGAAQRAVSRAGYDLMQKPARAEAIIAWLERR